MHNFQDLSTQFTCKIYFAHEFDIMRSNFIQLADKDEQILNKKNVQRNPSQPDLDATAISTNDNLDRKQSSNSIIGKGAESSSAQQHIDDTRCLFARSLCSSIQWKTSGGKSGSKFCKTKGWYFCW